MVIDESYFKEQSDIHIKSLSGNYVKSGDKVLCMEKGEYYKRRFLAVVIEDNPQYINMIPFDNKPMHHPLTISRKEFSVGMWRNTFNNYKIEHRW